MYNDVVKQLNVFGIDGAFTLPTSSTCCCNNNVSGLYALTNPFTCNALDIYTRNVHD